MASKIMKFAVASFLLAVCVRTSLAQDVVEVTATGQGVSADSARRDALRQALESGGGIEIASRSQVENFELIRDTIYARADGIITDYKVLEEGDAAGGVKFCKIIAKVSKSAIASTWGEVQNVLDQVGRPGVAVYIQERIDGVNQDSSILESQIEKRLLDAGFVVKAGDQLRAIAEREAADAASEENIAKMQAIAKDFGTQIFITGTAQANAAGVRDLFGEPTAMYNGDGMVKMYYTDTAQLLASESLANWRGGARGFREDSPQAGKKALENAGQELVQRVYETVMRQWATQISAGGELILEVEGVNAVDAIKIKKRLQEMDPDRVLNVNQSLTKGIATFRIKAKMTAEDLAERLIAPDWAAHIELVDIKSNRLQARKVQ
jgi:hypothetical protein